MGHGLTCGCWHQLVGYGFDLWAIDLLVKVLTWGHDTDIRNMAMTCGHDIDFRIKELTCGHSIDL